MLRGELLLWSREFSGIFELYAFLPEFKLILISRTRLENRIFTLPKSNFRRFSSWHDDFKLPPLVRIVVLPSELIQRASMVDPEGRSVILVVEDEPSYQDALNVGLTVEGFVVVAANNLAQARELLVSSKPDLVLLDVMLPDGSGVDFCREVNDSASTPVIMVSARSSEVDIVLGLELGAADYVTKPYRLRELIARIRAVLRRPANEATTDELITFGPLRMDLLRRSLTRDGAAIELSRKEFDLLALLASRLGQVVTREHCLDTLWWGLELSDTRTLDTHVKRLRQKIELDPANPKHLVTIRGVGFRLDQ
jgi:two-component system response regulator RegX3